MYSIIWSSGSKQFQETRATAKGAVALLERIRTTKAREISIFGRNLPGHYWDIRRADISPAREERLVRRVRHYLLGEDDFLSPHAIGHGTFLFPREK